MFPYAEDTPALGKEQAVDLAVALTVAGDLDVPEFAVGFRPRIVFGTTVPVAAINKNREMLGRKNEIGFSREFSVPPPTSDVMSAKNGDKAKLGVLVSAAAYTGHDSRTLGFGKNIGHG